MSGRRAVALYFTGHNVFAPRRTSTFFVTRELSRKGYDAAMVTVRLSWLSALKRDPRWAVARQRQLNVWHKAGPHLSGFVWASWFHPCRLPRVLEFLLTPLFVIYPMLMPRGLVARVREAELILIESGLPLVLMNRLKKLAPQAVFVYAALDRLNVLGVPRVVEKAARKNFRLFDLVYAPGDIPAGDLAGAKKVVPLPQGVEKKLFEGACKNPYREHSRNAVVAGDMLFDGEAVRVLAEHFADWQFHLFGAGAWLKNAPSNVVTHGEVAFEKLVPYLRHADVGVAPYRAVAGGDYVAKSSLKLAQYACCGLPVVAPERVAGGGVGKIFGYVPGEEKSLRGAFAQAAGYGRRRGDLRGVKDWSEVVALLLREVRHCQLSRKNVSASRV